LCDKHVARVALGAVFAGTSSQGCGHKHGGPALWAPCSPHNVKRSCPPAANQSARRSSRTSMAGRAGSQRWAAIRRRRGSRGSPRAVARGRAPRRAVCP
jgi:hypothetical protein